MKKVIVDKGVSFGGGGLAFIAGPCVIESREMALDLAKRLTALSRRLKVPYVFKASFDKANRTSVDSYRGPGLEKGLEILAEIRAKFDVPVLTDIHEPWQAKPVAEVCDILQIPASLARQTLPYGAIDGGLQFLFGVGARLFCGLLRALRGILAARVGISAVFLSKELEIDGVNVLHVFHGWFLLPFYVRRQFHRFAAAFGLIFEVFFA